MLGGAPLGQPGDVGPRLREVMASADVLAVEDTRRLHRLASDLGVTFTGRIVTLPRVGGAGPAARPAGRPRRRRHRAAAHRRRHALGVRPRLHAGAGRDRGGHRRHLGARAVGRDAPRWRCRGCRSTGSASRGSCRARAGSAGPRLAALADERRTMVFFESPHRLADALADAAAAFGADRAAAVCRELTKTYEEIRRGPLAELADVGRRGREAARSRWSSAGRRSRAGVADAGRAGRRGRRGGGRRGRPARTRSAPSSSAPGCPAAPSTTPSSPPRPT